MRIQKRGAQSMDSLILLYIKQARLGAQHNTRRVIEAWKEVSGAEEHCLKYFYKDGVLHVTMDSSVLAGFLSMQKASLIEKLNATLEQDELFLRDEPAAGFVKDIKLK